MNIDPQQVDPQQVAGYMALARELIGAFKAMAAKVTDRGERKDLEELDLIAYDEWDSMGYRLTPLGNAYIVENGLQGTA